MQEQPLTPLVPPAPPPQSSDVAEGGMRLFVISNDPYLFATVVKAGQTMKLEAEHLGCIGLYREEERAIGAASCVVIYDAIDHAAAMEDITLLFGEPDAPPRCRMVVTGTHSIVANLETHWANNPLFASLRFIPRSVFIVQARKLIEGVAVDELTIPGPEAVLSITNGAASVAEDRGYQQGTSTSDQGRRFQSKGGAHKDERKRRDEGRCESGGGRRQDNPQESPIIEDDDLLSISRDAMDEGPDN